MSHNSTTIEEWRPISGATRYEVSDQGRIRRLYTTVPPKVMKQRRHVVNGYMIVDVTHDNGRRITWRVHRLVMEAFVGLRPAHLETRHINGDETDNRLRNLVYGTHSDNMLDQVAHGGHWKARRDRCIRGHLFDAANTHIRDTDNARQCRQCRRELAATRRAQRALATTSEGA